jgi:monoamine oxidase
MPPHLAERFDVLVPEARRYAEAARVGRVVKVFAAYDRAFWRDYGWSGEAYWTDGLVRATVDVSPPDPDRPSVLLAFVVGKSAVEWTSARRADVIATLASRFGDRAASPIDVVDVDWGVDRWSEGCVVSIAPGTAENSTWLGRYGRLYIAGTEAALVWPGYMEGAIESGIRVADEILDALA